MFCSRIFLLGASLKYDHIHTYYRCYCISNALDGSEDDVLWEENGEDKYDSDWVTDNDSVW
jgi:hypothetical protein